MKISNETKIGILAVAAITILILGFNFLKGKNLFEKNDKIYAIFPKVNGAVKAKAQEQATINTAVKTLKAVLALMKIQ